MKIKTIYDLRKLIENSKKFEDIHFLRNKNNLIIGLRLVLSNTMFKYETFLGLKGKIFKGRVSIDAKILDNLLEIQIPKCYVYIEDKQCLYEVNLNIAKEDILLEKPMLNGDEMKSFSASDLIEFDI